MALLFLIEMYLAQGNMVKSKHGSHVTYFFQKSYIGDEVIAATINRD